VNRRCSNLSILLCCRDDISKKREHLTSLAPLTLHGLATNHCKNEQCVEKPTPDMNKIAGSRKGHDLHYHTTGHLRLALSLTVILSKLRDLKRQWKRRVNAFRMSVLIPFGNVRRSKNKAIFWKTQKTSVFLKTDPYINIK